MINNKQLFEMVETQFLSPFNHIGLITRPRLPPERGLGRSPSGGLGADPQKYSCGEAAPGFGAGPQLIQSSQPVLSRREEPNLSESSLAGGL
ncbi:MAG: hypothetical protein GY696_31260 [Gammaproteobacteria bacterium]|nr:hypothetical protein [Gammaproteobacteria bacterium]